MDFTVLPAIDLSDGQVVRLVQGRRDSRIDYDVSPASVARRFQTAGAEWLHVVNLDGAFDRQAEANRSALQSILTAGVRVQLGGGLRTVGDIERVIAMGVGRVILGTMAIEAGEEFAAALERFGPKRILVAIDARGGKLQSHGWTQARETSLLDFSEEIASRGVESVIYTSADRDGTGRGLDLETAVRIQTVSKLTTIVSGGVAGLQDVRRAKAHGLAGVIIGRALHDGRISLEEALQC